MTRGQSIEYALEGAASAWFGACVALALWLVLPLAVTSSACVALIAGATASFGALRLLQRSGSADFPVAAFDVAALGRSEPDDLILSDRLSPPAMAAEELLLKLEQRLGAGANQSEDDEELLLEDMLPEIAPDSRVIRLFDPAAMPTAGELQSRIDRHLQDREESAYPDAAQALNDALADLRRSLR